MIQSVTIDGWLPTMSANGSHGHWSRAKKSHDIDMETAWASCKHAGWRKFEGKVRVTITLLFGVNRRRDADNLHYRIKGCLDGIKDFCEDDDTEHLELIINSKYTPGTRATHIKMETLG